jgi:hypothetical protein
MPASVAECMPPVAISPLPVAELFHYGATGHATLGLNPSMCNTVFVVVGVFRQLKERNAYARGI